MSDERGQALVLTVFVLAIAAVAISGLRAGQDAVLALARERRAGEAAAAAAAALVADAYATELRAAAHATPARSPDVVPAVTDPGVAETARAAAAQLSLDNGGTTVESVSVRCDDGMVDVTVTMRGARYRAGFEAAACSRR